MTPSRRFAIRLVALVFGFAAPAAFAPRAHGSMEEPPEIAPAIQLLKVEFEATLEQRALGAADFDGDKILDVAVMGGTGLAVLYGQAEGNFTETIPIGGPYLYEDGPRAMTLVDVDGDGDLDIAMTRNLKSQREDVLHTFFNLGGGGFTGGQKNVFAGESTHSVAAGDIDADGDQDLSVANREPNTFTLMENTGLGIYVKSRQYPTDGEVWGILLEDMDGDGDLDAVTWEQAAVQISVHPNDGWGRFGPPKRFPSSWTPFNGAACDFDRDGDRDIVTANGRSFTLHLNAGDGTLGEPAVLASDSRGFRDIATADFEGDGKFEIATANYGGESISIYSGDGHNGFAELVHIPTGMDRDVNGFVPQPQRIVAADLDGDGDTDLAVGYDRGTRVSVFWNVTPSTRFRRGDANEDGSLDIGDAVAVLTLLFQGARTKPLCIDSLDSNDDGSVDITDPIGVLGFLFLSEPAALPAPGASCGLDPTADSLECRPEPSCQGGG